MPMKGWNWALCLQRGLRKPDDGSLKGGWAQERQATCSSEMRVKGWQGYGSPILRLIEWEVGLGLGNRVVQR